MLAFTFIGDGLRDALDPRTAIPRKARGPIEEPAVQTDARPALPQEGRRAA
jgi:hypothetical protein